MDLIREIRAAIDRALDDEEAAEAQRHREQVAEIDALYATAGPTAKPLHDRARSLAYVLHAQKLLSIERFRVRA